MLWLKLINMIGSIPWSSESYERFYLYKICLKEKKGYPQPLDCSYRGLLVAIYFMRCIRDGIPIDMDIKDYLIKS